MKEYNFSKPSFHWIVTDDLQKHKTKNTKSLFIKMITIQINMFNLRNSVHLFQCYWIIFFTNNLEQWFHFFVFARCFHYY